MNRYLVAIWLAPGAFGLPGPPLHMLTFDAFAPDEIGACEVAFRVCNSYWPDEMFCDDQYANVVKQYGGMRCRSLSVGDFVVVVPTPVGTSTAPSATPTPYLCASVGFKEATWADDLRATPARLPEQEGMFP